MRELRSCDFCGGDAVGTFEIVPPRLEPTEAEQRRVVLCEACKARLEALLEPLLARGGLGADDDVGVGVGVDADAGATAASRRFSDTADSPSRSERTTDSAPESGDGIERPGDGPGTGPGTGTGAGASAGAGGGAETGSHTGTTVEPGDATTADSDDRVNHSAGDTTDESDRQGARELEVRSIESEVDADSDGEIDDEDDGEGEGDDGSKNDRTATSASETDTSPAGSSESRRGTSSDGRARTQSPSRSGSESESESASRAATGSDSASHSPPAAGTGGPSRAYSKVVRLLRNREFPMDRVAVESLAAGAYELENHEVEAIVDHAIERGEFRADGDKLRRPSS